MIHRLLLSDPLRVKSRDDKLWVRDQRRAKLYGLRRLPCPCAIHRGVGVPYKLEEIEKHLFRHGRSPDCRTWRGPDDPNSSDEEWENDFSAKNKEAIQRGRERDSGLQMRQMMHDMYQQVEAFAQTEEQLNEETMNALEASDRILGVNELDVEVEATHGDTGIKHMTSKTEIPQEDTTLDPQTQIMVTLSTPKQTRAVQKMYTGSNNSI